MSDADILREHQSGESRIIAESQGASREAESATDEETENEADEVTYRPGIDCERCWAELVVEGTPIKSGQVPRVAGTNLCTVCCDDLYGPKDSTLKAVEQGAWDDMRSGGAK